MKKIFFVTFILYNFAFFKPLEAQNTHIISLGPNIFYRVFHEKFPPPGKSNEYGMHYGALLGYQRIFDNSPYISLKIGAAYGNIRYDGSLIYASSNTAIPFKSQTDSSILELEALQGFNWKISKKSHFCPFLGIEYYCWDREAQEFDEIYQWITFLAGFKAFYKTKGIQFGLDVKGGVSSFGSLEIRRPLPSFVKLTLKNRPQWYVALPLQSSIHKKIDWKILPYFIYRGIGGSKHPGRTSIRFISFPHSYSYRIGMAAKININF